MGDSGDVEWEGRGGEKKRGWVGVRSGVGGWNEERERWTGMKRKQKGERERDSC